MACSAGEQVAVAEGQVARFHARLNASEFDAIYDSSSDLFKKSAAKDDIIRFLRGVRSKLGAVTETKQAHWNLQYDPAGTFVILTYETQFDSKSKATEQFSFLIEKPEPKLVGYTVNSPDLLTK
jgi:hypothetical protein